MRGYFESFPDSYDPTSRRIINTPSHFAKSALYYVQEVGYIKIRKSHLTRRENLESYLFVVLLSGEGTLYYDNKTYHLSAGDCFWIDCMLAHSYQSSQNNPWEIVWLHFHGSSSKKYYDYFISQHENRWHPVSAEKLTVALQEIMDLYSQNQITSEIIASKLITDLLTLIITAVSSTTQHAETVQPSKLNIVRDYIDGHYLDKLTLDFLAQEFFISKYHLCREFRKAFGLSITDYIQLQRITYAKRILRFSDTNIEEIAIICSMTDASHFTKVFRRSEGITPSMFRKRWRDRSR